MKKLLGLFLAMAMSFPAGAAIVDNVEAIGRIDVIGADANRGTVANSAASRVVAGLAADLTEDVKANVQFWYATGWDGSTSGTAISSETSDGYLQKIHLAEANVVLSNLFDCFELTLGRQFYGDEDSALLYFGPRHGYHQRRRRRLPDMFEEPPPQNFGIGHIAANQIVTESA